MSIDPMIIWFLIGVFIFLMELAHPAFFFFFFGLGAWIVAILLIFLPLELTVQLLIFLLSSIALLILLRKKFSVVFSGFRNRKDNPNKDLDEYTGKKVKVIEAIRPPDKGKVRLHGTPWLAEAEQEIEAGTTVEITAKDNITLKVRPVA